MAYGFNDDRSKVDVYPKNQVYSKSEIGPGFSNSKTVNDKINDLAALLPSSSFDNENTVYEAIKAIGDILPAASFDNINTVDKAIGSLREQVSDINNSMFSNHGVNPSGLDFDNPLIASGSYFVNSASSGTFPSGKTWGILLSFSAGSNNAAQLMFCDSSLAYRLYVNDTWQAWTFC